MAAIFDRFARWTERQLGHPVTFAVACLSIFLWGVTGPFFSWSDTWQLVINTGTTIVTFLMVFLIQSTQNRDTQALQLKLDELIRVNEAARNSLMGLEERPESEIKELKSEFVGSPTTGVPCRNAPHPSPLPASGEGEGPRATNCEFAIHKIV